VMFEFYGMIALCLLLWFLVIGPAIFGAMFDIDKFTDAIKLNALICVIALAIAVFVFLLVMCINFLSGDPQPITNFISNLQTKGDN